MKTLEQVNHMIIYWKPVGNINAIAVAPDGMLWIGCGGEGVRVLNSDGEFVRRVPETQPARKPTFYCAGIAFNDNEVFISQADRNRVVVCNKKTGTCRRVIAGDFENPAGLACAFGQLWVVDSNNNRVQVFDHRGERLSKVSDFDQPQSTAISPSGMVLVADTGNDRVAKLNANNIKTNTGRRRHYHERFGSYRRATAKPRQFWFQRPTGVAIDHEGYVFVCDDRRVHAFKPDGAQGGVCGC